MWLDKELALKDLPEQDRKELAKLQEKALVGELRQRDLSTWSGRGKTTDTPRSYVAKLTSLRKRCANVKGMPPEVVKCLDEAIAILTARQQLASVSFASLKVERQA